MPELPEVETIRRSLAPVIGNRIVGVWTSGQDLRVPLPTVALGELRGQYIVGSDRHGKYLLLELSEGLRLLFHFGMTGTLSLRATASTRSPHDHVAFELEGGGELVLNDPRRFGLVRVVPPHEQPEELTRLGPDAWSGTYDAHYLYLRSRNREVAIKNWLMDQRILAGLGNIYANEALHRAAIRPGRSARRLSRTAVECLHDAIRSTLVEAIAAGGSSISDFRDGNGRPGYFQHCFRVYDRAGQPCGSCGTSIRRRLISGRSSFYCPACQR